MEALIKRSLEIREDPLTIGIEHHKTNHYAAFWAFVPFLSFHFSYTMKWETS
jgi:hypothetical protein